MKASYDWLRSLVPALGDSPSELAARLTFAGLEVEAMHRYGAPREGCVVARVQGVRAHPTKSGLRLVAVDAGGAPMEIVCGAPNVPAPGGLVVLAKLGAELADMRIERRTIAGVVSEGMLCSEAELGLTEASEGILVLPEGLAAPGTPLFKAIAETSDTIFEIGVTPNRPDALGHIGLAREIAALYKIKWHESSFESPWEGVTKDGAVAVRVEAPDRCPHYGAAVVSDVTVGPSPLAMRYRLAALGVRPISNLVDITNYVMLESGHPMHAFDLELLRGKTISVRCARGGEKLETLDGETRALAADDLVICDAEGPVALAGVMGGARSEIRATTKHALFECAYFDPRGVRRTARRYGMHTESSHRFERGVDPGRVRYALSHATALAVRLAGARALGRPVHAIAEEPKKRTAPLRASQITRLVGAEIPIDEAHDILERLGCVAERRGKDALFVLPSHRPDLAREVDLIEEVVRVRGFDKVPTALPAVRPSRETHGAREALARRARQAAVELGLSEALTYGFVAPAALEALGAPRAHVTLQNPLRESVSVMRTSLLPGLLESVARARRHGEDAARMFTIGPIFLGAANPKDLPEERMAMAAVLAGEREAYLAKPASWDVWDAKALALDLTFRLTGARAELDAFGAEHAPPKHLHPRGSAALVVGGARVGTFGLLHPDACDAFELRDNVVLVELDLGGPLAEPRKPPRFVPLSRYPASSRDIALVVHESIAAGDIERAVREAAGPLAEDVHIFDRFVGGAVPKEHASLAFRVVYRAPDRTLTDAEVDAQHERVVGAVRTRFGATLRS